MELSKNRLVIDGFVISENLHNTLTANTLFGITSKKDVHIGHDNKTWVLESDIICDTCYNCDNCTSCVACTSCDNCTTCQACQGCTGFCTSCASGCHSTCFGDCYTCQDCQTGCTGCDGCTTNCTTGCNTSCYSCVSCQNCDTACQGCDGCTTGCTGICQTSCQTSVQTTACSDCQTGCTSDCQTGCIDDCQGCTTRCNSCTGCASCTSCVGCNSCTGCDGCTGCTTCDGGCTGCTACTTCDGNTGPTGCDTGCTTGETTSKIVIERFCPSSVANGLANGVCNVNTGKFDPYAQLTNLSPEALEILGITEAEWDSLTPEAQADLCAEHPEIELKDYNNDSTILAATESLEIATGQSMEGIVPGKVEECSGGQTVQTYVKLDCLQTAFTTTQTADGELTINNSDGSITEAKLDPTNGKLDESVDIKTTNTDGSQNTKPSNPENTSTPSTYTPPPSSSNPNPTPQPSGC